ncbi:DUF418 domain-containing protein [Alkalihalobacillus sp. AL-G]|uniref:DUF418 domain-containing protein n=1 Tax=Alkalihalobacillus sp. AL-G TaxID=2926399 RepID=UPI002729742E|nr:DUF418 domain-containing protein [Alkalihalobacillus sp. AL-G]WLD93292.1 DUF418 domain-containing protein [Alkalihalobacillus sp. AL-G]
MKPAPITANERIVSLDIIRGFALLGIFLVNMPSFFAPALKYDFYGLTPEYTGVDQWVRLIFDLFVQAKFYPMFSFLFGLGFYIFLTRAEKNLEEPTWLFVRRLFILLLFGLLHLILFWYGDILHTYAVTGFFLLFFFNRKPITILIWAIGLISFYYALLASNLLAPESLLERAQAWNQSVGSEKVAEAVQIYDQGSLIQLLTYRFMNEVLPILENLPYQIPHILGLFLFGLYIGKKEIISNPSLHKRFIKLTWIISGLIAIPFTVWLTAIQLNLMDYGAYQDIMSLFVLTVGGPFLTAFYIFSFVRLLQKDRWQRFLKPIGITGRMALTNYLAQTIITLVILLGFDLYNNIGLTIGLLLTIGIFILQVVFSVYWLNRFRFGPLEWVWRSLTYGHRQLIRLEKQERDTD